MKAIPLLFDSSKITGAHHTFLCESPKEHDARERKAEDNNEAFTAEREKQQLEKYEMCFRLFRKYRRYISGVTFWNISDRHSWLDNFPVTNRKDYPLLFDEDLKPKRAFWKVVQF